MHQSNSIWSPHSVPGVQAQPWKYNYRDGECGLHKTNDGWAALDPNMEFSKVRREREQKVKTRRRRGR